MAPAERGEALRLVAGLVSSHRLAPLLGASLQVGAPAELTREALRLARLHHELAQAPAVRTLLGATRDEAVQVAAVEALERFAEPVDAEALLELVGAEAGACDAVRLAAARALGALGTIAHVPRLRAIAEVASSRSEHPPGPWPELAEVVARAVARIQLRRGGAESGALTLVEDRSIGGGAVSLAPTDGGLAIAGEGGRLDGAVSLPVSRREGSS